MSAARIFLLRLARRVWFRATIFTVLAIVFALIARFLGPLLPFSPTLDLGQGSVDSILQILATSMLAVTTFSLTAMVTAYSSAASIATPRATQLLIADTTSQNVLSTFVGAFTYSMVGIIALSTGFYTSDSRTLLFLGTLVVIIIIVVTLLRWIAHLADFGRMADIIDRVEGAASTTLTAYAKQPSLGARVQAAPPDAARAITDDRIGYVTHVDLSALERVAAQADVQVHIATIAGQVASPGAPLAYVEGSVDESTEKALRSAFQIEAHRTFEQDPRLGVIALSEIGSRALSPSVNDPGTAIEVLGALQRVFTLTLTEARDSEVRHPHIWVTPVDLGDLIEDGFRPIARDGAALIEVSVRVQKVLASLADAAPDQAPLFRAAGERAARRAEASLPRVDVRTLRQVRKSLWR